MSDPSIMTVALRHAASLRESGLATPPTRKRRRRASRRLFPPSPRTPPPRTSVWSAFGYITCRDTAKCDGPRSRSTHQRPAKRDASRSPPPHDPSDRRLRSADVRVRGLGQGFVKSALALLQIVVQRARRRLLMVGLAGQAALSWSRSLRNCAASARADAPRPKARSTMRASPRM